VRGACHRLHADRLLVFGRHRRLPLRRKPSGPADDRARHRSTRSDRAHDALLHARGPERGLRPHRPRQGPQQPPRRCHPCAPQRADPGRDRHRSPGRFAALRRDPHRDDFRLAGCRSLAGGIRAAPRLSGRAGRRFVDRHPGDAGQSWRRSHLWLPESKDPPLMSDAALAAHSAQPMPGRLRLFWRSFAENRGAVLGLIIMLVLLTLAVTANVVAPHSPIQQFRDHFLAPPMWQQGGLAEFPLGTDDVGRDILSRLIYGARLSLIIGFAVVTLSLATGIVLGLTAAFADGLLDTAIMRLMDIVLVFPSLLLAIVIVAILGPGLFNAMIAVAIVTLPSYTRLTRAAALSELARDYVTATRCAGAGPLRLMFDTVLPNCLAPLIVQATLGFSTAILDAAALGFL